MGPGLEEPLFLDNSLYRVLGTITLTPWISERPEEKIFFWGGLRYINDFWLFFLTICMAHRFYKYIYECWGIVLNVFFHILN